MRVENCIEVDYHVLTDYRQDLSARNATLDMRFVEATEKDEALRTKRRWFTSLAWDRADKRLYCGQTHRAGQLLHAFDPSTGAFEDLGFDEVAEDNDMKIHRGLWLDEDERALYFGLATLSSVPALIEAPGGRLMRYDIDARRFDTIGIPLPGNYIQATSYDPVRRMMYAFFEPTKSFAAWSLEEGRLVRAHFVDSIVHVSDVDDDGGVWGTATGRHVFFRYDPSDDAMTLPEGCVLPTARQASGILYGGAGPVDCLINGGDGFMYVTTGLGELYRLDPASCELDYIGRPLPWLRAPAIRVGRDGYLYGVGGDNGMTFLWRCDRTSESFEVLGRVAAEDGTACFRPHDMVLAGGTAYVAETDSPGRSGYLWECRGAVGEKPRTA
ncbi:MAG: hypothetical protein ACOC8E_06365 [Planctomycetota bacterium]